METALVSVKKRFSGKIIIFVIKLFIITTLTALFFSLIPIPDIPIIEDRITNCITGGIVCGFG